MTPPPHTGPVGRAMQLPATLATGLELMVARSLHDPETIRDAVQETLARTVEALREDRVPRHVSIEAYAHGIARHVIADQVRDVIRERARTGVPIERLTSAEPDQLHALVRREEVDRVRGALALLPAAERLLLEEIFVEGRRVAAIARRTGEPEARLRKRKSRALERLRSALDERR